MGTIYLQRSILLATSALGVALSAPAAAQDQSSDIIVTARRVEERLQDVPISITVFNQQQLTTRNVVNAGDLAAYTPSLAANGRFGAENTSFAIRGFVQDPGTAPSVAVYFADVGALRAAGGTTLGNGAGPGSFFDLSNVQVLKGAQGTLFGRNTTGGAVLLVPQKPTGKFEGYVEGSIGNYDMKRVQAVVNIPVMETLRIRIGVDRQTRTGFLNNYSGIGPKDFADTDYTAVRFSAVADLTPNLENYFIGTYSNSDTSGFLPKIVNCAPGIYPATGGSAAANAANVTAAYQAQLGCTQVAREAATGDPYAVENATYSPRQHVQQFQLINTTTWKASDNLTIKNIASYGEFRQYFRSSPYGEYLVLPSGPNAGGLLVKSQSTPPPGLNSAAQSTFSEELQFQGSSFADKLNWQGGFYAELSEPLGFSGSVSPNSGVCNNDVTNQCLSAGVTIPGGSAITGRIIGRLNSQKFQNYGIYGQATYKLSDQFSLTGGLRYTWDATTAVTQQFLLGLPPTLSLPVTPSAATLVQSCIIAGDSPANSCLHTFHTSSQKPTWLLGLDYKPTDDILVYAKYTRGYRTGGIKTDGGLAYSLFEPEKVDTFEGGFKTGFRGAISGTFNVSAFYSKFLSQQLAARLDPNPLGSLAGSSPPNVVVGGARSRIYGVEVEGSISPFQGFKIDGSYAYLNTKLESVATPPNVSTGAVPDYLPPVPNSTLVGYPLAYAPRNKFSVTASYTLPLDESIGRVSFGGTFSHSDSQLVASSYLIPVSLANANVPGNFVGNQGLLPALNLVNANVNWAGVLGSSVDLSFFVTNLTKERYAASVFGGISAFGYDAAAMGEPRMYGFRLKYRFGN